jgi:hypothetical protein
VKWQRRILCTIPAFAPEGQIVRTASSRPVLEQNTAKMQVKRSIAMETRPAGHATKLYNRYSNCEKNYNLFVRQSVLHKVAYGLYDLNFATPAAEISGWVSSDTHKRAVLMTATAMRSNERMNVTSSQQAGMLQINQHSFITRHSFSTGGLFYTFSSQLCDGSNCPILFCCFTSVSLLNCHRLNYFHKLVLK